MPYATSKIVPNSMHTTPLPGAIAERFQVSVTYIFASHKWKFENRKRCLNCQYSPTENPLLAFRSANTVFIEVYINLSFDHHFRSGTMTAVFDTGTHLRQPWGYPRIGSGLLLTPMHQLDSILMVQAGYVISQLEELNSIKIEIQFLDLRDSVQHSKLAISKYLQGKMVTA